MSNSPYWSGAEASLNITLLFLISQLPMQMKWQQKESYLKIIQ